MNEHADETFKSMIEISVEGMKSLLLINGGAAITVLTFLGTNSGKSFASHAGISLARFILGVTFSVCIFVFSYATQFALFNESINNKNYNGPRHMTFVLAALVFVFLSLIAFCIGCASSIFVLTHYI
jgi:hypothetical protein